MPEIFEMGKRVWWPSVFLRALVLLSALGSACGTVYTDMEPRAVPQTPLQGAVAEFKALSFDGKDLKGRLLLGATADTLIIDGRLFEYSEVELRDLQTCDSKKPLTYHEFDYYRPPMKPEDRITIQPGYWYGTDLHFHLFDEHIMAVFPDCFEAKLMVWVLDGRLAATLPIRVIRSDQPKPM